MSKTDKTRPYFVRLTDHGDLVAQEVHNHHNSECNLPPLTAEGTLAVRQYASDCYWTFRYDGKNLCGCNMCTARDERHHERKSLRRAESIALKNTIKACNSGVAAEDVDVFVPGRRF